MGRINIVNVNTFHKVIRSNIYRTLIRLVLLSHTFHRVLGQRDGTTDRCQGETNVAMVVAVSTAVSVGLIGLTLLLIFLLIRKKLSGTIFLSKNPGSGSGEDNVQSIDMEEAGNDGFDNPACSVVEAEEGQGNASLTQHKDNAISKMIYISCSMSNGILSKHCHLSEDLKFVFGIYKAGDKNSVWHQSHDVVDIGFNIAGNMRDGIYVSQIRSENSAVKSNNMNVGDRILSVTVAYENIVYEDALKILSYASPYPVKVSLQKRENDNHQSRFNEKINHPIFRSQSHDDISLFSKPPMHCENRARISMTTDDKQDLQSNISDIYSDIIVHSPESQLNLPTVLLQNENTKNIENPSTMFSENNNNNIPSNVDLNTGAIDEFTNLLDQSSDANNHKEDTCAHSTDTKFQDKTENNSDQEKCTVSTFGLVEQSNSIQQPQERLLQAHFETQDTQSVHLQMEQESTIFEVNEEQIQPIYCKKEILLGNERIKCCPLNGEFQHDKVMLSGDFDDLSSISEQQFYPASKHYTSHSIINSTCSHKYTQCLPKHVSNQHEEAKEEHNQTQQTLDHEDLDMVIAMNTFPPGSQGLAGILAGGKQGGIHDEFFSEDVTNAPTNKSKNYFVSSTGMNSKMSSQHGAVAYEVRDVVLTGRPVPVELHSKRNSNGNHNTGLGLPLRKTEQITSLPENPKQLRYIHLSKSYSNEIDKG